MPSEEQVASLVRSVRRWRWLAGGATALLTAAMLLGQAQPTPVVPASGPLPAPFRPGHTVQVVSGNRFTILEVHHEYIRVQKVDAEGKPYGPKYWTHAPTRFDSLMEE